MQSTQVNALLKHSVSRVYELCLGFKLISLPSLYYMVNRTIRQKGAHRMSYNTFLKTSDTLTTMTN